MRFHEQNGNNAKTLSEKNSLEKQGYDQCAPGTQREESSTVSDIPKSVFPGEPQIQGKQGTAFNPKCPKLGEQTLRCSRTQGKHSRWWVEWMHMVDGVGGLAGRLSDHA